MCPLGDCPQPTSRRYSKYAGGNLGCSATSESISESVSRVRLAIPHNSTAHPPGRCNGVVSRETRMRPRSRCNVLFGGTNHRLLFDYFNPIPVVDYRPAIICPSHEPELRLGLLFDGVAV